MVDAFTKSESLGGNCQFLGRDLGEDPRFPSVFGISNHQDLIFLGEDTGEDDLLSRVLKGPVIRIARRPLRARFLSSSRTHSQDPGTDKESNLLHHFSDRKLRFVLDVFSSAISSIIPCISIIVLFFVHDLLKRLALGSEYGRRTRT